MQSAKLPIITLDGPAGVGKTSLARALAEDLDLPCLDTGAMFRFIAFKLGDQASDWPIEKIRTELEKLHFSIKGQGASTILFCNGEQESNKLRSEEIGNLASRLASMHVVREFARKEQQKIGLTKALVAEGRDMGTVVFPEAAIKFFLEAAPEIRARRRYLQLLERGEKPSLESLEKNIRERDERDRTRKLAPLKPAQDSHIINTGELNLYQSLELLKQLIAPELSRFKAED